MIGIVYKKSFFSERWVDYCLKKNISFKLLDPYSSDIIREVQQCTSFMWHFDHMENSDALFAKQLIFSIENMGIKVFPNVNSSWHFNDKVGQKYLLEAIGSSLVPTYIFYEKKRAMEWAYEVSYPFVFKLRGGAGSLNVRLINSRSEAKRLIRRAFGNGFPQFDSWVVLNERLRKYFIGKSSIQSVLKWFLAIFLGSKVTGLYQREQGYFYCQEFIKDCKFDIRVVVIGSKAIAIKRLVRKGDFRASGSGYIIYDKEEINISCIKEAFEIHRKLKAQCMTYDFLIDHLLIPHLVEVSFGYTMEAYDSCDGYWDDTLKWNPYIGQHEHWMVDLMINPL